MNEKEKTIKKYMGKLGISREEAEQLYLDDKDDFIGEEGEEFTKKAVKNGIRTDVKRKPTKAKKERKVDAEKGFILENITKVLVSMGASNTATKTETEVSFVFNDNKYTVKLTKHRPPKGESK